MLRDSHSGQRLLLVEDNAINCEVAVELLSAAGLVVESAEDGALAIDMASTGHYDLILMDMQMPVMDGLECTRIIRTRLGAAVPIIAMTANAFGEDRLACLEAGMDDHLAKPVDPVLLYAALLRWLPLPERPSRPATALPRSTTPLAEVAKTTLVERLAQVEGLDMKQGLRNVGGLMPSLRRTLLSFANQYRAGAPALLGVGVPEDIGRWSAACHSLKGACSAIGANVLQSSLSSFELEIRNGTDSLKLARMARSLDDELQSFVRRLIPALDEGE